MDLGHLAKTLVIEELSRVSGAIGAMVQASQLGVAKVLHFGTERQKARWLPRFASGDLLPTIAVTEPASGGHVLGMRSTAVRENGSFVLSGRKCFVGSSHIGDAHGVVVRTGPGSRAQKLGAMNSRLMTARLTAYHAVHLLDQRRDCDAELMNAKLVTTESALTSARAALEIFAGHGCQQDQHIERYLRDVIHTFPAAGTSDVQRLRLAQVALGAYRGAWSGRLRELETDRLFQAA